MGEHKSVSTEDYLNSLFEYFDESESCRAAPMPIMILPVTVCPKTRPTAVNVQVEVHYLCHRPYVRRRTTLAIYKPSWIGRFAPILCHTGGGAMWSKAFSSANG